MLNKQHVAFVGFGLSGVGLFCSYIDAAIRRRQKPIMIIYEKNRQRFATGFPYDIDTPACWTLNGPAANEFRVLLNGKTLQSWMDENRAVWSKKFDEMDEQYPPRALVGEYIKAIYADHKQKALMNGIQIEIRFEEVIDIKQIEKNKFLIQTDFGKSKVDFIGLGVGHLPSDNFHEFTGMDHFIDNPFDVMQLKKIPHDLNEIVIIGGHLTFIDAAKYLILMKQFKGRIISVTRRSSLILFRDNICTVPPEPLTALVSEFHKAKENKLSLQEVMILFLDTYLKSVKNPIKLNMNTLKAEADIHYVLNSQLGIYDRANNLDLSLGDFSELMDFMKIFVASDCYKAMWSALSCDDQKQFMKQFYSTIISYFVGVPLSSARFLKERLSTGQIQKYSGVVECQFDELTQEYILRFNDGVEKKTKYLINATGQGLAIPRHFNKFPLLENLLKNGLITVTSYGMLTNEVNQIINAEAEPIPNFIAVGPSVYNYGEPAPEGSLLINFATNRAIDIYFKFKSYFLD